MQLDAPGAEYLRLLDDGGAVQAHSTIVGFRDGHPFSLTYLLRCDPRWRVLSLRMECRTGDQLTTLDLDADGEGSWRQHGQPLDTVQGCLDVDIAVTPFTNTLPIRRLELKPGDVAEIRVVYIDVPTLTIAPMRQRYIGLRAPATDDVYRYESLESGFTADLRVDRDRLVIDYPHLWRIWTR
jgi:uncharacterized protein